MSLGRLVLRSIACALVAALHPGCADSHMRSDTDASSATEPDAHVALGDGGTTIVAPVSSLAWMIVHPSDAPRGPGLYLFDESRNQVVSHLPLPDELESPHALAWDGESLWLGGAGLDSAVYELDSVDASVRSRLPNIRTEGITIEGDTLWLADDDNFGSVRLVRLARDGTELFSALLPTTTLQDLTIARGALYYLVNDGVDRIVRFDRATGASVDLVRGVHVAPYSLAFDGAHLVVAVEGTLRRYDPATGELVRVSSIDVPGWITALAFQRHE